MPRELTDHELGNAASGVSAHAPDRASTLSPAGPNPRLPLYQPVTLMLVAFATGIFIERMSETSWIVFLSVAALSLAAFSGLAFFRHKHERKSGMTGSRPAGLRRTEIACSILLMTAVASTGAFWGQSRWQWYGQHEISRFAAGTPSPVCVDAVTTSEPRLMAARETTPMNAMPSSTRTTIAVRVIRIRAGSEWQPSSGIVDLVVAGDSTHVRSGDRIRIYGTLSQIRHETNPGQFDFSTFYRARGRLALLRAYAFDSVQVITPATRWSSGRLLSNLRRRLNDTAWTYISPRRAALASTILLGNREQLTGARRDSFLLTGTVHLLAISGLHVGILAGLFVMLYRLNLISRRKYLICTIAFVIFYAWLVEFRPPVTRASILIVLFCLARMSGQLRSSFNWLAVAGLIVLILNPADLFEVGPQLSFLAVATIAIGYRWIACRGSSDPLHQLIARTRPFPVRVLNHAGRNIRAAFLMSAIIWLVAMPLVAMRFNLSAPVALLANPVSLVPIACALYAGLGTLVFGSVFPPVAVVCGKMCDWNLGLVEWLIAVATSVPGGHVWTSGPAPSSVLFFYTALLLMAAWPPVRVSGKRILMFIFWWIILGWMVPAQIQDAYEPGTAETRPLAATFIDVGHGTSVLIQLPDGRNLLYDAGSLGSADYGMRNVSAVLWHEQISHLDAVIISHADIDHFNGVPGLCERFSIGEVLVSEQMLIESSDSVEFLFSKIASHHIPVRAVAAGDQLLTGKSTSIRVLSPSESGTGGSDNSDSIVLQIDHVKKSMLLAGDLEGPGLFRLLAGGPQHFDIVMAPHHGSCGSLPEQVARWATPESVVISCAGKKFASDVADLFVANGARVFATCRDGAVRIELTANDKDDPAIRVDTWYKAREQGEYFSQGYADGR